MTIIVEITTFNPVKGVKASSRERAFRDYEEFKTYYKRAKEEKGTLINVRFYDAISDPKMGVIYDNIIQKYTNVAYAVVREK